MLPKKDNACYEDDSASFPRTSHSIFFNGISCPPLRKPKQGYVEFKNKAQKRENYASLKLKSKFLWYQFSRQNLKRKNLKPTEQAEDYSISSIISTTGTNSNTTSAVKDFSELKEDKREIAPSRWKIFKLIPEEKGDSGKSTSLSIGNMTITFNNDSALKGLQNFKTLKVVL